MITLVEAEGAADEGSTHDIRHYVAEDRAYVAYELDLTGTGEACAPGRGGTR